MKYLAFLLLLVAVSATAAPYPVNPNVQLISPARCPVGVVPVVNSQGTGGAPLAVTTHAEVIPGNATRQAYSFLSDGDFCAEYGDQLNNAPTTEPVGASPCTAGTYYVSGVLYVEYVYPTDRMDAACVSGTCHIYTVECNP
jgi:hypothetical protein